MKYNKKLYIEEDKLLLSLKYNQDVSKDAIADIEEVLKNTDSNIDDSLLLLSQITNKEFKYEDIPRNNISLENQKKTNLYKSIEEIYKEAKNYYGDVEIGIEDILSKEEIQQSLDNIKQIEEEFKRKIKLKWLDIKFLMLATAIQTMKTLAFPYVSEKFNYGETIDKDSRLNHNDKSIKNEMKERKDEFRDKHEESHGAGQWINFLYQTPPYDITKGSKDIGINMGGAYHRQPTLGHDPILGFIFGTANILTDTITFTNFDTYKVQRTPSMRITADNINIFELASQSYKIIKEDYLNLPSALLAQYLHLKSDINTKLGLPVPIISVIDNDFSNELYKEGYDFLCSARDMAIIGTSYGLSQFIDMVISILHSFFREETEDKKLYEVKTRKILLYSNLIAASSTIIATLITKNVKTLDIGGVLSAVTRLFCDVRFILNIKSEFIQMTLEEEFKKELDKIDEMLDELL